MIDIAKALSRNGRALTKHKSMTRIGLEKSSKLYIAPLAIIGAGVLILDSWATFKSSVK